MLSDDAQSTQVIKRMSAALGCSPNKYGPPRPVLGTISLDYGGNTFSPL
jgi:hypothetical protein